MSTGIERYERDGVEVSVETKLKGKHWGHDLCLLCRLHHPMDGRLAMENCPISSLLHWLGIAQGITTVVWECAKFETSEIPPKRMEEIGRLMDEKLAEGRAASSASEPVEGRLPRPRHDPNLGVEMSGWR